jgi:hypothetical protein
MHWDQGVVVGAGDISATKLPKGSCRHAQSMGNTVSKCILAIICTVSLFSRAYGQQGSFQWEKIQKSMYDLASDGYELKSAESEYAWEGTSLRVSFVTYYLQK